MLALVKLWVVSTVVKQLPATLNCSLQFPPYTPKICSSSKDKQLHLFNLK